MLKSHYLSFHELFQQFQNHLFVVPHDATSINAAENCRYDLWHLGQTKLVTNGKTMRKKFRFAAQIT